MKILVKYPIVILLGLVGGISTAFYFAQDKEVLISVPTPTAFLPSEEQRAPASVSNCPNEYEQLLGNETIQILVLFGYKDTRPTRFVGDRYERMMFSQYLIADCPDGWHACGFQRNHHSPEVFTKTIAGPDGHPRNVVLTLLSSSAGADDQANRKNSFQYWLSERALAQFEKGLKVADIVFYNGHSRDGGGPDFSPPKLRSDNHVDYDWYIQNKPGERLLLSGLKGKSNTKLVGLYSCSSTEHFLKEMHQTKRGLATVTSKRLLYFSNALRNMLGTLSGILGMKCGPDLRNLIHADSKVGSSKLIGFFPNKEGN